ncbi:hypothetical protein KKB99_04630 [bacterium]|nr:hypothetical protein [bacterium]MBU1025281.1 hypothetical protein [bacterium]
MRFNLVLILISMMLLFTGCPFQSGDIKVQPQRDSGAVTNSPVNQVMETVQNPLSEPEIDNDYILKSMKQSFLITLLGRDLVLYREATGSLPLNAEELITSGFTIWWPVDLFNSEPVRISDKREKHELVDLGSFRYDVKRNPPYNYTLKDIFNFEFEIVTRKMNNKTKRETEGLWTERGIRFPADLTQVRNYPGPEKLERFISIAWGKKGIYEVEDSHVRLLYAKCGAMVSILMQMTTKFFDKNNYLPGSFNELLSGEQFIIKENFEKLSEEIQSSNVDFIYGYDNDQLIEYAVLKINGETYIEGCKQFDNSGSGQSLGSGCTHLMNMSDINISSVILNNDNMDSLVISEEYLLTVHDFN